LKPNATRIRAFLPVLALLVPAFATAPARGGPAEDARRLLEMAESPDMAEREEICRELYKGRTVAFARWFCEGYDLAAHGFDAEAEVALDKALADRPDFALGAILFGDLYEHLGKGDRAEHFFRRAIEIAPNRSDARFSLGSLLFRRGRDEDPKYFAGALEAFRQMTEADPGSPDGWSNLGLVLTHLGRMEEAEKMYKQAIALDPDEPFLYDSLGSLYARAERNGDAEAAWMKAIALNPSYGEAVIDLAALYARTGRLTKAIQLLERERPAVQAPPWGPRIRRNLGFAYLGLDRLDAAGERFNEATAGQGGDALAHLGLAHLRMVQENVPGALVEFERGARADSALTVPFVRPWRDALRFRVDPKAHPELQRIMQGLEGSSEPGPAGAAATPALVAFVLEEWSFADAARVREELTAAGGAAAVEYDTPPIPVQQVPAEYTESAQRAGMRGTVSVRVTVNEAGQVAAATMEDCQAPITLCESAVAAAKKWTFQPALRYGEPVRATVVIPFRFTTSAR